ncbi:MAG: hypothetical protein DME21_16410 [Verrucomicrobia bacterium]|nr:MAG: hypothetical protein DME21_16410 [Verrucomicrobiota bacterium]
MTNKAGVKNNGQPGDVIISWFKLLDESFDGPNYTNEIYVMVVNGLTDPTGRAVDCLQEIKLNFAFPSGSTGVDMLDPASGQVQTQTLPIVNNRRQLVLNLNGGDAALFKFSDGAPFVGITPIPARLDFQTQGGALSVRIQGAAGSRCQLEAAPSLPSTNWTTLTNLLLPSSPYVFQDTTSSNLSTRFYRVVGVP